MFDIHITGNSLDEIADKALALGNRLSGTASTEKPATTKPKVEKPAAKAPEPEAQTEQPAAEELPAKLDFHLHVAKAVTDAVGRVGKPATAECINQFGVAKASDVPEEQWGEFVAALNDLGS